MLKQYTIFFESLTSGIKLIAPMPRTEGFLFDSMEEAEDALEKLVVDAPGKIFYIIPTYTKLNP